METALIVRLLKPVENEAEAVLLQDLGQFGLRSQIDRRIGLLLIPGRNCFRGMPFSLLCCFYFDLIGFYARIAHEGYPLRAQSPNATRD
jgi:hypothetical protein